MRLAPRVYFTFGAALWWIDSLDASRSPPKWTSRPAPVQVIAFGVTHVLHHTARSAAINRSVCSGLPTEIRMQLSSPALL